MEILTCPMKFSMREFARPVRCYGYNSHGRNFSVSCSSSVEIGPENIKIDPSKITLKDENNSLEVSRIVNGMWQVSSPSWGRFDPEKAVEAMFRHSDAGLITFDMADIYGPAERLFGEFMDKARRTRGEEYASKIQGLTKYVPRPEKMTRQVVEEAIDRSRRSMQVKALDMVQFHWWAYEVDGYIDALKHLTDLKDEGKIKTVALTNFDTKRLIAILGNQIPVVSNQVQHSLVDMRPQKSMAEVCQLTGVQLITYGTVLGGLLSEKYLDSREPGSFGGPKITTPSEKKYKQMIDAWGGWRLFQELLRELKTISRKHNVSLTTAGIKAVLEQPCVAASMVGVRFSLSDHIEDSKAVFGLTLDEEDWQRINSVLSRSRDLTSRFGDCGDEYR